MIDAEQKADLLEPVWQHYGGRILGPSGNGWRKATCVFHDDKHPSAQVNLREGVWGCLSCGRKGDVFTLVQEQESDLSFPDVKRQAAELAGVDPETLDCSTAPVRRGGKRAYRPAWL